MKAGTLDQRVVIKARSVTTDEVGQAVITWVPFATVWAQCQAVRGREFFAAAQVQQEQTLKVRIRHMDGIDQTMRLEWDGRGYDITGVVPVGRKDMIELMCLAGVKDGR